MNWKALNNYTVLEMLKEGLEIRKGIYVPEVLMGEPRWAKVLDVGEGVPDFDGNIVKPEWPKPGHLAYVMNHGRQHIPVWEEGELKYLDIASVLDILAVWDEESMSLIPLGQGIEVEPIEAPDQVNGIYIPDSQKIISGFGKVISVGKGWRAVNGKEVPFQVKVGDIIAYKPLEIMKVDMRPLGFQCEKEIVYHGAVLAVYQTESASEDVSQ